METIATVVKNFLIPGSTSFLLLGLLIGVVFVYLGRNWSQWGRRLLLAMLALYSVMSLPIASDVIGAGLDQGHSPLMTRTAAKGATAVVVLSGGSSTYRTELGEINSMSGPTAFRTLEAVRIYRLLDDPWVIVSGGIGNAHTTLTPESKPMKASLIEAGVPHERILLEPASRNTYEHALNLGPLLTDYSIDSFVLVTSPSHMWRSRATFEAQGLKVISSAATEHSIGQAAFGNPFIPSMRALENTRVYLREYLALVLYWSRGLLIPLE